MIKKLIAKIEDMLFGCRHIWYPYLTMDRSDLERCCKCGDFKKINAVDALLREVQHDLEKDEYGRYKNIGGDLPDIEKLRRKREEDLERLKGKKP
jgi:hypothetical protein